VAATAPRLLAIIGSGETAPTMARVHRDLLDRLGPPPVPAVVLDTPFGFQVNADDLAARAVGYFRESVQREISVATYRSLAEAGSVEYETMLNRVRSARYVFTGPGSPSYALRQWRGTEVPVVLVEKLRTGGCLTFASAAAVTLGPFALPVYEIYKAGEPPHWLEGLDVLGEIGLPAVVIPHFDNAEGGTHDTRYCYMGERRLQVLEEMLPEDVFILGVAEHTACIFDLDAGTVSVSGRGAVTVRRQGRMEAIPAAESIPISAFSAMALARPASGPAAAGPERAATFTPGEGSTSPLLADVARGAADFEGAVAGGDSRAAVKAVLGLDDLILAWSRDSMESDELDRARAALRSMVVRLGEAAESGLRDPRELVAPFVEALLAARRQARAERRWADADALRDRLVDAGIEVKDTPEGTSWELR
jgi:cyanophycinase-like exopeptidase